VPDQESQQQKAIRLLKRRLEELQAIRALNVEHPHFTAWRDTTRGNLERFLGKESHHTARFVNTSFQFPGYLRTDYPGSVRRIDVTVAHQQAEAFKKGCDKAEASLRAAKDEVAEFGVVNSEDTKPVPNGRGTSGGISQNFHGPVSIQNLAIAADSAIQKIGHMGNETAPSLKEIAALLQQSEDLTPRQVKAGLAHIEAVATEVEKPEAKRNWKSVLESGKAILELVGKATDLGTKLAPYTPAVLGLVEKAKHYL
jgi:hypothetical protein